MHVRCWPRHLTQTLRNLEARLHTPCNTSQTPRETSQTCYDNLAIPRTQLTNTMQCLATLTQTPCNTSQQSYTSLHNRAAFLQTPRNTSHTTDNPSHKLANTLTLALHNLVNSYTDTPRNISQTYYKNLATSHRQLTNALQQLTTIIQQTCKTIIKRHGMCRA